MRTQVRSVCSAISVAALFLSAWPVWAGAPAGRYTIDSAKGTVLDNETRLMWQRDAPQSTCDWLGALAYCDGLASGDYSDWRLPNVKELQTIVDIGTYNPAIDTTAFLAAPSGFFWSSSPSSTYTTNAWGVDFFDGKASVNGTTNSGRVRCVRGG